MSLVKRTVYIDENVDRCVDETWIALRRRKVPRASYSLALNMMLAAIVLEFVYGRAPSKPVKERMRKHARNPAKSPIIEGTIPAWIRKLDDPITYIVADES
jgi:hypothetical protein